MPRWSCAVFALVNAFALWGLFAGAWLQARQQRGARPGRGAPVFDEPLVNYMVGVREDRPRLRVVDPVAVIPTQPKRPPPQTFPRVFEQRDILVDDPVNKVSDIVVPPQQPKAPTKETMRNDPDIATVRIKYPPHEFVPFTVIGADPTAFLQTSRASYEREVHHAFTGELWHVRNRFLRVPLPDCGSSSQLSSFVTDGTRGQSLVVRKAAIALAPQVWSWQHFVQDAMPKIFTMLDLGLIDHSRPLLLPPPRDAIIPEILNMLNLTWIPEPRSGPSFYAEDIVIACHVPGAHPRLWRGVRRVLTSIAPIVSQRYLVYLSRKNAHNGRKETNYQELRKMLQNTFRGEIREFTGGKLLDVIHIFAGADIVVGSHGGGLYNSLFATENTCVVEQQSKNVYLHSSNREIFHRITTQIGQRYIRVIRDDGSFDFHIEHLREAVLTCLSMNDSRDNHLHSSAEMKTLEQNVTSEPDNVTTSNSRDDYLKPTDKVDFIIPWINYSMGYTESKTTPFDFGAPLYNIVSEFGLKRPPWTEICWSVRSILYHGGPSVGTIYIVYNAHRHPAPACNFQNSQVVSMPQQKFLQHTVLDHPNMSSPRPHAVLQFVHQIKNLRNFFIFSMDDIFLLKRFQVTNFYDFTSQKILTHMTAGRNGISPGTAYGASELEKYFKRRVEHGDGLHVPFMVRRKSQEKLTEALAHLFSHCPPPVHLCDFGTHYQSLVQNFMILEGVAENRAPSQFSEIHTTSSTRLYQALTHSAATWLDVQGTGVSDEYGGDEGNRIRIREEFDRWLQEQAFYRDQEQKHPFRLLHGQGRQKYDVSDTAIGSMVKNVASTRITKSIAQFITLNPISNTRKIISCFAYNGERDITLKRIQSTSVSFFVVSESNFSVDGSSKPWKWKNSFNLSQPRIKYIQLNQNYFQGDSNEHRWQQEVAVREILGTGVKELYESSAIDDNDIVLVTDADEIVDDTTLEDMRKTLKHGEYAEVFLSWFLYNKCWSHVQKTIIPVAVTVQTLRKNLDWNTHYIRAIHNPKVFKHSLRKLTLSNSVHGYHCSWCFGKEEFRRKVATALEIPTAIKRQYYSDARIDIMWRLGMNIHGQVHGNNICNARDFESQLSSNSNIDTHF